MTRKAVSLRAIAKPLPVVEFPNGSTHQLRAFDATGWRVFREGQATPDANVRNAKGLELLKLCVPSATMDDIATLGTEDLVYIFAQCSRQFDSTATQAALAAATEALRTHSTTMSPDLAS